MGMRACRTFEGTDEVVSGVDLDTVRDRTGKLNIRDVDFVDHRWSYLGGDVVLDVSNICRTLLMPSRKRQNILMKSVTFSKVCQNDKNVPKKPGDTKSQRHVSQVRDHPNTTKTHWDAHYVAH